MKKIILFFVLCLMSVTMSAQEFVAPAKKGRTAFTDTTTTYTYKCPEKTYDVYKSRGGAFYIWKVSSKSGKLYKYYLPKEIQVQMGRVYPKKD